MFPLLFALSFTRASRRAISLFPVDRERLAENGAWARFRGPTARQCGLQHGIKGQNGIAEIFAI